MNQAPNYPAVITAFKVVTPDERDLYFRRHARAFVRSALTYNDTGECIQPGDPPSSRDISGSINVAMRVYDWQDGEVLLRLSGRVFPCVLEIPDLCVAVRGRFEIVTFERDATDERGAPCMLQVAWARLASALRVDVPGDSNHLGFCPIG